jgi:hypothetical protein
MGEIVRQRVLRALGLAGLWVRLDAMATRIKRLEQDVVVLQRGGPGIVCFGASPPPAVKGER